MKINPATCLPTIDITGNPIGSDDYIGVGRSDLYSSNKKETKEESDLNDIGAYIMLVLGSGLFIYSFYGAEIEAILKKIF